MVKLIEYPLDLEATIELSRIKQQMIKKANVSIADIRASSLWTRHNTFRKVIMRNTINEVIDRQQFIKELKTNIAYVRSKGAPEFPLLETATEY